MRELRWWHVGVVGTSVVLTGILLLTEPNPVNRAVGLAAILTFVAAWFAFGRNFGQSVRAANAMIAVLVVTTPLATWGAPTLAVMQAIAYPIIWSALRRTSHAIVISVLVAALTGLALFLTVGATPGALTTALISQSLSLTFTIVFGLWVTSIEVQSHERQRLLLELQAAQDQLATLSRDAGVTSERERLAREIHDTIAQDLTGLVLLAQRTARELAAGNTAAASEQLVILEEGARTALAETRALVAAGAPPALESGGIAAALERLGDRLQRETTIVVTVQASVTETVDRDLEVVLLRCAQEGLANVRKHSGASRARVRLVWRSDERSLQVSDNGSGFDVTAASNAASGGYGLNGMRDRLALVGGSLGLETGEEGTTLLVTLPVPDRAGARA